MNTEKKFRVWDNVDYMSTPFTLQDLQLKTIQFTSDCKVMQWTGLTDKNKIEIFEGDYLRFEYYHPEMGKIKYEGEVVFETGKAAYAVEYMDGEYEYFGDMVYQQQCEVIGNIYSNPELVNNE